MATIDPGVPGPGDSANILEINNLAAAQSEVNQMLIGYTRNIFNNTPSKPQAVYTEGDEIVFDFPSSRDFINFAGSQLQFDLAFNWEPGRTAAGEGESALGVSWAHIFDRLEIYNGSTKVESIEEYGKYVFHEFKTKMVSGGEYQAQGYFGGVHPQADTDTGFVRTVGNIPQPTCVYSSLVFPTTTDADPAQTTTEYMKLIFPVKSLFERSGYMPIGNIFKGLQFRFRIASRYEFAWLSDYNAAVAHPPSFEEVDGYYFEITNPVWKMDSLLYSLGAMPALGEHVFHTFGTRVSRLAVEATENARYILDYNWSSLKRCVSFLDPVKNTAMKCAMPAAQVAIQFKVPWSQGYWDPSKEYEYYYNAGTVRFPEEDPVSDKRSGYYHYLKSTHMQDVAGDLSDPVGGMCRDTDITTAGNVLGKFSSGVYMCAKFDKLDQSGSVISGTDVSNRYVILQVENECDTINRVITLFSTGDWTESPSAERYVICNYDVFIILYGGAIAIQD